MDWTDLCSVADVCPHLNDLARAVFRSKWTHFELTVSSADEVEKCLSHFGAELVSLCLIPTKLFDPSAYERMLIAIVENCRDSLTSLEAHRFMFDYNEKLIDATEPLFSKLQKLTLKDSVLYIGWLGVFSELTELILIYSTISGGKSYTKRESSMLLTLKIQDQEYMVESYYGKWQKTKYTSITVDHKAMKDAFKMMNRSKGQRDPVAHVEVISNIFDYSADATILKFKNLKSLKVLLPVAYNCVDLIQALRDHTELYHLTYRSTACNLTADYLLKLIENGKSLQQIHIAFEENLGLKIDEESYRNMLDVVEQRETGTPLQMIFICKKEDFNAIDIHPDRMYPSLYIYKYPIPL